MNVLTNYTHVAHELHKNEEAIRIQINTFEIIFVAGGLNDAEIHDFTNDKFEYGLFRQDSIPILLLETAGHQYDFFLNVYDLFIKPGANLLNEYKGWASYTIVAPHTFTPIARREFRFDQGFHLLLKNALMEQLRVYKNTHEVNKKVIDIGSYLYTRDMFTTTKMYKVPSIDGVKV